MEIRKLITLQFIIIVAFIMLLSSIAIYISFSESRREEFYDRLSSKAKLVGQMLLDIDEIDRGLLRKIERNNPLSLPAEKIKIYDHANSLIYISDTLMDIEYPIDKINEIREKSEIRFKKDGFEIVGHYYSSVSDQIVVFVAARDIFGLKKLQRLRNILLMVFCISLFILYISGRVFAKRALKPISSLINEINNIETSNISIQLDEGNGTDEISKLAQTFNSFLKRLELSVDMQKNFISNASHELRTPLTVMSGQLEVMMLKKRKVEEYTSTLQSIHEEIKKLTDISNRLLLLAKANSDFRNEDFVRCRIDEVLWKSRQELINRNNNYNIEISFTDEIDSEDSLIVFGNELLLKTAFLNLMDNGCKYSKSQAVNVLISCEDGKHLKINFRDNGIGVSEADINNIFQPFYRSKEVLDIKGHGIGLSLVEKIIILHHGDIKVHSEYGKGSVFTVMLPLTS